MDLAELLLEAVQWVELMHRLEGQITDTFVDTLLSVAPVTRQFLYLKPLNSSTNYANLANQLSKKRWDVETGRHRKIGHATSILTVAYNDLAMAWACHGEWEKAVALLKESRTIREGLPDFTKDKLFSPLYHLGLVYHHQGKFDDAETVLNEAIQDRENRFGREDTSSVRSTALFYAQGNVRFSRADQTRQDIRMSYVDHMEAVSRARRSVGAKNRATLICQYQVARVSAKLEDYEGACILLGDILANTLDKPMYHRDIARTSYLYAKCLHIQGKVAESRTEILRSLEIHNRLRPRQQRTAETLTEEDIGKLIPYDYL
ncbi:hypothetical protein MMC25_001950 [Agyrium rufum]|nr:hypothetical protein [Agyrium rufum]